jgi:type I restriction enzyme M protein
LEEIQPLRRGPILIKLSITKTKRWRINFMADTRKEQERDELHKAIWSIADDLRGSVDGWDFKSYILSTMFYRFISENLTNYINDGEAEAGNTEFDYAKMSDADAEEARAGLVEEKGFFILPSELFCNVRKAAKADSAMFTDKEGNKRSVKANLNEYLEMIFQNIEDSAKGQLSEDDFAGLFDDFDVNSNKLGATVAKRNEKLIKLLDGIGDMKLGNYKENTIDAFGDAYEYLMTMYASNAGKSGGEFYTPQEVSELLTRLAIVGKTEINKVYDPACGSGSLLLKAAKILGKEHVRQGFFGQEINITTYNLCRINMFLHDIDYDKFDIACEDTLISPQHWDDEPFEVIVSNPPYSIKWAGDDNPLLINDPRFSPAGVLAPKSKADLAFIMHSLSWLATNGTAAIVCFPGIMYRGGAEQKIRKYLVDNNYIDCIIQLPSNLFFGTSIATCIMVLKKNKSDSNVLFIDASNEYVKVTNNNKLTEDNISKIVNAFADKAEIEHFAYRASYDEVKEQNYNLSVSTYVEQEDTREKIDIVKLNAEIQEIVAREQVLREEIDKIIAEIEGGQDA